MHLRFTDDELAILVEMVSLAANVSSWNHKPGSDEGVSAYEMLEEKILGKAIHAGLGDVVEFSEEKQRHQLTAEYQEQAFFADCYDEFRNESFWEELVIRMADRDLAKQIGREKWEQLGEDERRRLTEDLEKRYWEEFGKNGVDRLALIYPPGEG